MLKYIGRRLLLLIPTVWALVTLAFLAIHFIPGDAADFLLQDNATREVAKQIRENLGLNRPLWEQYFGWFINMFKGDLGTSYLTGRAILPDILLRFPATIELTLGGIVVALIIAVPAGILSGVWRGRLPDAVIRLGAFIGVSIPSFWLALMLVVLISVQWRALPSSGYVSVFEDPVGNLRHLLLPSIALGVGMAGAVTRMLRASVVESLQQDYVRVAHAKGVPSGVVVRRHAVRPALIPAITLVALLIGSLIGGTVVIEKVFAWPGNGRFLLDAIFARDYPVVQAMIVAYGVLFVLINLAVDIVYGLVDPRVRRT